MKTATTFSTLLNYSHNRAARQIKIFGLFALLLAFGSKSFAGYYKADVGKKVYMDIANAIKDNRKIPSFNFIKTGEDMYDNAYYDPSNYTINLGEKIYDICISFGADSLNALAMVLGHELAHFYKDHDWGMNFGTSHFKTEIAEEIYDLNLTSERRAEMEAEADYFGGFFGYLAGYNSLGVGPEFYDKLYTELEIPDETFGYPTREDRMSIAKNARKELEELIAVFDAANYLIMIKEYEEAGRCLDLIRIKFPSREVLSNAGVCRTMEAITTYKPEDLQYIFPFGIDTETRMKSGGTKGGGEETPEEKRERLLKEAIDLFNEAIRVDQAYAQGYINLSLAQSLIGEFDLAAANAAKGGRLAKEQSLPLLVANAEIARGIALSFSGDDEGAKTAFTAARTGNAAVADVNLKQIGKKGTSAYSVTGTGSGEKVVAVTETIGEDELEPSLLEVVMEDDSKMFHLKGETETMPELRVYSAHDAEWYALTIKSYTYPKIIFNLIQTEAGYTKASARGIKVGADIKQVEEKYGIPSQVFSGPKKSFYMYEKTPIIFIFDEKHKVTNWVIYNKQ